MELLRVSTRAPAVSLILLFPNPPSQPQSQDAPESPQNDSGLRGRGFGWVGSQRVLSRLRELYRAS
jgi:hypothetical protein